MSWNPLADRLKDLLMGVLRHRIGQHRVVVGSVDGARSGDTLTSRGVLRSVGSDNARGGESSSSAIGSTGTTFDYYIGPSGSDSNAGTLSSPWAITALWTKASTYAGKRLGILDGTYSGYNGGTYNGNDYAHYVPATASGTVGARTVIGAVNARQAILNGAGGNAGAGFTRARVVLLVQGAYVTVQELDVRGGGLFGIQTNAANVTVLGCECHDINRVTYGDGGYDNQAGISTSNSSSGVRLAHNYCHDIVTGSGTGANECGILMYHGTNAVVEYNEVTAVNTGIFLKDDDGGAVVRYNYLHGVGRPLYYGTNNGFAYTIHSNVVEGWTQDGYNSDNYVEGAGTALYNNTFIVSAAGAVGWLVRASSSNPVTFYNNLIARSGGSSSSYGDMTAAGSGTFALSDYNLYGSTATFHSPAGSSRTFAAYKTQIGGLDTHSVNADPTFVGGGSGPYQWKLSGGSRGLNEGSSDGTTSGSAVNIGAFASSGQTEQIGPNWRWPA